MPIRVFLAVEGRNDGGALGSSQEVRSNDASDEGALQPLIRRLLPGARIEFVGHKMMMLPLKAITDPEAAIGRRARLVSTIAAYHGCDALVFHQDVDGPSDGIADDGEAAWNAVVNTIADGVELAEDEDDGLAAERCVAAVPLRTIEAWLVSDNDAVVAVARPGSEDIAELAREPEALWGDAADKWSSHPKRVFQRGLGGPNRKVRTATYRALGESASVEALRSACPTSFEPFASDLVAALAA